MGAYFFLGLSVTMKLGTGCQDLGTYSPQTAGWESEYVWPLPFMAAGRACRCPFSEKAREARGGLAGGCGPETV